MSLLLILFSILLAIYLYSKRRPKNFPPGPISLPVVGSLPFLGLRAYRTLFEWRTTYGPIIGFDFAGTKCIAISDLKLIKEAASEHMFSARPPLAFMSLRSGGGEPEGIIFSSGRKWQEQKRFTLRKLRDFGFGTRSMEAIVHDEIKELIEKFTEDVGKPISTTARFNISGLNALWTIVAGERFQTDDPRLQEIVKGTNQDLSTISIFTALAMFTPWMSNYLPEWITHISRTMGQSKKALAIIRPTIDSHYQTHIQNQPRDFLDAYIDEVKSTEDPTSSFHISKRNTFDFTVFDLFMAGAETISATMSWTFLYMARHPHVQEKLAAEIQRVVGNSRLPTLADRAEMPYTEAVIHEVMRKTTLTPVPMISSFEDTAFHGFAIPKDCLIFLNLWAAHNDPAIWNDPENFRPERFLNKDETKFVHHEGFIPFSTGKRVCLGERLARDELFLFTVSLFQAFEVGTDPSGPPPTLESTPAGVLLPLPHKLVLKLRN